MGQVECFGCGSGSKYGCVKRKGKSRVVCYGTRKACKKRGCRVTGYSSTCSSASNVQKC